MSQFKIRMQILSSVTLTLLTSLAGAAIAGPDAPTDVRYRPKFGPDAQSIRLPHLNFHGLKAFGRLSDPKGIMINYEPAEASSAWGMPVNGDGKRRAVGGEMTTKNTHQVNGLELKQLIIGKTIIVSDPPSGDEYEILYGPDGRCVVRRISATWRERENVGEIWTSDELGSPSKYEVTADGRVRTRLDGRDFTVTVYKDGNEYVAVRSDAFERPAEN